MPLGRDVRWSTDTVETTMKRKNEEKLKELIEAAESLLSELKDLEMAEAVTDAAERLRLAIDAAKEI